MPSAVTGLIKLAVVRLQRDSVLCMSMSVWTEGANSAKKRETSFSDGLLRQRHCSHCTHIDSCPTMHLGCKLGHAMRFSFPDMVFALRPKHSADASAQGQDLPAAAESGMPPAKHPFGSWKLPVWGKVPCEHDNDAPAAFIAHWEKLARMLFSIFVAWFRADIQRCFY